LGPQSHVKLAELAQKQPHSQRLVPMPKHQLDSKSLA
jgi:hypothetical protein